MVEFETIDSVLRMKFSVKVRNSKRLEVALIYPWTVTENELFLNKLVEEAKTNKSIYINKETVVYSYESMQLSIQKDLFI